MELAEAHTLYPARRLLIGSLEALALSHPKGSNHHSLIGDLNPGDLVEMDCTDAERGWPRVALSLLCLTLRKAQRKVSRSRGVDLKESCLVALR